MDSETVHVARIRRELEEELDRQRARIRHAHERTSPEHRARPPDAAAAAAASPSPKQLRAQVDELRAALAAETAASARANDSSRLLKVAQAQLGNDIDSSLGLVRKAAEDRSAEAAARVRTLDAQLLACEELLREAVDARELAEAARSDLAARHTAEAARADREAARAYATEARARLLDSGLAAAVGARETAEAARGVLADNLAAERTRADCEAARADVAEARLHALEAALREALSERDAARDTAVEAGSLADALATRAKAAQAAWAVAAEAAARDAAAREAAESALSLFAFEVESASPKRRPSAQPGSPGARPPPDARPPYAHCMAAGGTAAAGSAARDGGWARAAPAARFEPPGAAWLHRAADGGADGTTAGVLAARLARAVGSLDGLWARVGLTDAEQAHWLRAEYAQLLAALAALAADAEPAGAAAPHAAALAAALHAAEAEVWRSRCAYPVVSAVRLRESLKARLAAFALEATDPQRLFGRQPPGRLLWEAEERAALMAELGRLNRLLAQLLPLYARVVGEPFLWRGVDYLEAMEVDVLAIERAAELRNVRAVRVM